MNGVVANQSLFPGKETQRITPKYMNFQPSLTAVKVIEELNVGRLTSRDEVSPFQVLEYLLLSSIDIPLLLTDA